MLKRSRLKLIFYINLLIVGLLVAYKIYLDFFEQDFKAIHADQVERIQARLTGKSSFSFAVVGNINNSVGIFERKIVPMLNAAGVDFVVSAGNAVSSGGEDKYRALYRTLSHLQMPYLLTFGEHEEDNFGTFRFYDHFGPYFYDFSAGDSRYIFLDSTGKTSYSWQLRWLEEQLDIPGSEHEFLFMGHPVLRTRHETLFKNNNNYLNAPEFRQRLLSLVSSHQVDAVFSANLPFFEHQKRQGVDYITTGGAGGLVYNDDISYYHFVKVTVNSGQVTIVPEQLNIGQHRIFKTLESLWFFIHSLFYVGYLNFLLIVSILIIISIKLYVTIFVEKDYYRNFDLDPSPYLRQPLKVAMFTNNYLPFIGGVPISIDRLRRGLIRLSNKVLIVAPHYHRQTREEPDTFRVSSLLAFGAKSEFRLANIFLPRIHRQLNTFKPDIIHLHHPFWLGSLGLVIARRLKIPAVYTYHTRLETLAHFVPLPGLLFRNLISHYLIKRFANKCDGVIVPTQSAEEYLRLIGVKTSIFVQPTGIDYERFQQVDSTALERLRQQFGISDECVFVSVARLSKEKNIEFMLDAIYSLKQRSSKPFKFLIIGDGNERERLKSRIDSLGLSDSVILVGEVPPDEIPDYYQLGDVFLFASRAETQGMVILEAMAAGLPVLAVRSSGIDDLLQDGINGFKTAEDHGKWCDKAYQLMNDDVLRQRLSDNALAFAKGFDIEQFARGIVGIYAQALAHRANEHVIPESSQRQR